MPNVLLDVKGLNCPLPILKAKKAIRNVEENGILEVLATDPGAEKDFLAFCDMGNYELLVNECSNGVFRFLIKKIT